MVTFVVWLKKTDSVLEVHNLSIGESLVQDWQHLHTYHITHALPTQDQVEDTIDPERLKIAEGVFRAGDYLMNGSIQSAFKSGRLAAEAVMESLT